MSVCCTRTTSPTSCPLRPDAACRDEWALFDATISADRGRPLDAVKLARIQALAVCDSCPALGDCRTWLDSLPPSQRPAGVVAGVLSTRRPLGYKSTRSA